MPSGSLMDRLDGLSIRDLRAMVVLAERLHFGKAAEDLAMAQPSLTAALQKVERVVGERLFDRTSRRVALTPAGQLVVQRMRSALEEISEISPTQRPRASALSGRFRLGLVPTIGPYYTPRFLGALRQRFPKLSLLLTEALAESLLQRLSERTLDAAVVCLPTGEPGLTEIPLLREPFVLAVPTGHPLGASAEVTPGQLDLREMLLMERGHCLQSLTIELCGTTPGDSLIPTQAASVETLRHLVAAGNGCAILPQMAVSWGPGSAEHRDLVRYIPFRDPSPSRTIGFVFHERCARAEDAMSLGRFLSEIQDR